MHKKENKKSRHSRVSLSGIFNVCRGLLSYGKQQNVEGPRLQPSGMTSYFMKKAFTLIELLVVVLIIGILSAIALPQYRVAVMKARAMQAVILMDSIWQAQQVYYLANGEYGNLSDLDIQLPTPLPSTPRENTPYYSWGSCYNDPSSYYEGYCAVGTSLCYFRRYTNGLRQCRVYLDRADSDVASKVCMSLGFVYKRTNSNENYDEYE